MPQTRGMSEDQSKMLLEMLKQINDRMDQQSEAIKKQMTENSEELKAVFEQKLSQQIGEMKGVLEEEKGRVQFMENKLAETVEEVQHLSKKVEETVEKFAKIEEIVEEVVQIKEHLNEKVEEALSKKMKGLKVSEATSTPFPPLNECIRINEKIKLKPSPFTGKSSWEEYHTQFEIIANINEWNDKEKASMLAGMLRDGALSVLLNLPENQRLEYDKLISALKLRFGSAHLTELFYGQLQGKRQALREDLTTFAYDVQTLARRAFINSPVETQELVAARQFVEGIGDPEVQTMVRLSNPQTIQEALIKALETEAATKATWSSSTKGRWVGVDEEEPIVKAAKYFRGNQNPRREQPVFRETNSSTKFTSWRCGQEGHVRSGCRVPISKRTAEQGTNTTHEYVSEN